MTSSPPPVTRLAPLSRSLSAPAALLSALAAVTAVALAAQVEVAIPGTPVPQSLQTLAVVVAGGLLGARRGAGALALYALVGAAGLPVFAGGASGVDRLVGPTGGFLAGFVAGAALAGAWRERGWCTSFLPALAGTLLAHAVILAAGWGRLALLVGPETAWEQGVAPFLVGGVVKAGGAAGLLRVLPSGAGPGPGAHRRRPVGTTTSRSIAATSEERRPMDRVTLPRPKGYGRHRVNNPWGVFTPRRPEVGLN